MKEINDFQQSKYRLNSEYIDEINEMLKPLENYKLRFIYGIVKGILERNENK